MVAEPFKFAGVNGQMLDGRIELAHGKLRGTALFAHCFTCGKQSLAATRIAKALAADGWSVLRFDFTGLGDSDGDFGNSGFNGNVEDLVAATKALELTHQAPALLVGHSLGGAAVIAAADHNASATAVATIGAPFNVEHLLERLDQDGLARVAKSGAAPVSINGREFCLTNDFIAQVHHQPQGERLAKLDRALLVMHAPSDRIVGLDNAKSIFDAAKHPKSFVALDGADHLLTAPGSADYAAGIIAAWASRYAMVEQ
ncbi:MAG: alpha/beta fold hydrolase [Sphingomonas sp.]|nr:alpha/beta fold hydrolase [Sphingomonas sp.]